MSPDERFINAPLGPTFNPFNTRRGTFVPAKFSNSVFEPEPLGAAMVRLLTVRELEKFCTVEGAMATALKPELVMNTDWELSGKIPSDHTGSSQLPLVGLVHELSAARA